MLPTPDGKFDFTGYIADETMEGLVDKYGLESVTCKAGSLLLMKINIVHGSSINMSPLRRLTCYLNVCPVDNHPDPAQPRRRPWFCERRPTPLPGSPLLALLLDRLFFFACCCSCSRSSACSCSCSCSPDADKPRALRRSRGA